MVGAAVLLASAAVPGRARATEAELDRTTALIERLEQRVQELEERLAEQEAANVDVHRLEGEIVTLREDAANWSDVAVDSGTDFNLSGYVETSYTYNFNNPRGPIPATGVGRIFDFNNDTFEVNAARLSLENTADEIGDAGFRVDLTYGTLADLIGSANTGVGVGDDDIDLTQAYVNYIANVGNGLELKAGKFVTWIGYEVIEAHNNPNYSRSYTFGLSIPFAHTGVGASYQFNDAVAYSQYLVNGWDNAIDENDQKSTGGQLVLTPSEDATFGIPIEFYFNWIYGYENTPQALPFGDDQRFVLDWIITAQFNDQWAAALNIDYGESDYEDALPALPAALPGGPFAGGTVDNEWFGIAGYLTYQHTDALGFALRAEYWEEDTGTRTGIFTTDRALAQDLGLFELTGTVNYWLTENLFTRAELRYDHANRDVFIGDGAADFEDDQVTLGFNATYVF